MPDNQLKLSDVPGENATADELFEFARNFDGYRAAGGGHECGRIAQSPDLNSITELRIAMFFTLRAIRHCGDDFGPPDEAMFRDYTARIRALLVAGDESP